MYRDQEAATIACSACRKPVKKEETLFSAQGDVICMRCHGFDAAHAQVERARVAQIEAGAARGGLLGAIQALSADGDAQRHHSDLAVIAQIAQPLAAPDQVRCQACGTGVASAAAVYTPNGMLVCNACSSRMKEDARVRSESQARMLKIMGIIAFVLMLLAGFLLLYLGATR